MNTTTNWSAYRPLTASEQELFQNLLGKELGVEALLVSLNDSDKKFTEYIFMYNHPDPSTPNLVSFYAKVESKKETVVEFATAQLTATMATSRLVENSAVNSIVENVSQKVGFTSVLSYADVAANYSSSSQANYFFDCTNSWFGKSENERWIKNANGEIIEPKTPTGSYGSFCCVLQKGKEYFILTAGHNLSNGTTVASKYKLIKDATNYIELELIADYRTDGYDAAVLKINKIKEGGEVVYDVTDTSTNNDDITKSKDFYGKAISFGNNVAINVENRYPDLDERKDGAGNPISIVSTTVGYSGTKVYSRKFYKPNIKSDKLYYYKPQIENGSGLSGGCVFKESNPKLLAGVHKGIGNFGSIPCSTFTPIDILPNTNYTII